MPSKYDFDIFNHLLAKTDHRVSLDDVKARGVVWQRIDPVHVSAVLICQRIPGNKTHIVELLHFSR